MYAKPLRARDQSIKMPLGMRRVDRVDHDCRILAKHAVEIDIRRFAEALDRELEGRIYRFEARKATQYQFTGRTSGCVEDPETVLC